MLTLIRDWAVESLYSPSQCPEVSHADFLLMCRILCLMRNKRWKREPTGGLSFSGWEIIKCNNFTKISWYPKESLMVLASYAYVESVAHTIAKLLVSPASPTTPALTCWHLLPILPFTTDLSTTGYKLLRLTLKKPSKYLREVLAIGKHNQRSKWDWPPAQTLTLNLQRILCFQKHSGSLKFTIFKCFSWWRSHQGPHIIPEHYHCLFWVGIRLQ